MTVLLCRNTLYIVWNNRRAATKMSLKQWQHLFWQLVYVQGLISGWDLKKKKKQM